MPEDTTDLRAIIIGAIAYAAQMDPSEVHDDVKVSDLGLDSLSFAGILIDIEDSVGAEVPAEVLDRFLEAGHVMTIRDVVGIVSSWDPTEVSAPGPYDVVVIDLP